MTVMDIPDTSKAKNSTKSFSIYQLNSGKTLRVICCVLFIILTEFLLAYCVYKLINAKLQEEYVTQSNFQRYFLNEIENAIYDHDFFKKINTELYRNELKELISEVPGSRQKRAVQNRKKNLQNQTEEPKVEFFNPKMRLSLEKKDQEIMRKTGHKGAAPGGDSWIWVTSSSRIPEKALEGYCKKVHEFCPRTPGPQGPPGQKGQLGARGHPGLPGDMGNRGFTGQKGTTGEKGASGSPGVKGDKGSKGDRGYNGFPGLPGQKGEEGRPGLPGQDGLPGEAGLYGTPGRNGYDGKPGNNGNPGEPGHPAVDGKNGKDGPKGEMGPPGLPGFPGPKGATGPRGPKGVPGSDGQPGTPGIVAWKITDQDKYNPNITNYLIAPSIAGAQEHPMVYNFLEGDNARLHCSATGIPPPQVAWKKMGNKSISRGAWQDIEVSGPTLELPRINRDNMGSYICIADNGVPPQANQMFIVEVSFPPLIRVVHPMVGVTEGSTVVLKCETEAFPEPIRYWERDDGIRLENDMKYTVTISEINRYKSVMQVNISRVANEDIVHRYFCVSYNEFQETVGEIQLFDSRRPPSQGSNKQEKIFGPPPPEKISLEDLCGPTITCPDCECNTGGVSLIDLITRWEVKGFTGNTTYPGYGKKVKDCVLYAVGKPEFHRYTNNKYGCWMKDSNPTPEENDQKIWVTYHDYNTALYEYTNETMFKKNATINNQ